MSVKTQRKIKAEPSSKTGTVKRPRRSASGTTAKPNGKHPLTVYEHLHIGIVEASLDGKYTDANAEFCRILGYSKKELLRLGIRDCTHEDDYGLDIKLHEQLVGGKVPSYGLEKRFVRKDGRIVWVELTRSLILDEGGKPVGTIGAVLDISDRKQVERALRESAESLRLATEAARMFKWEFDFQKKIYTLADNFAQVLGFSAGLLSQNNAETLQRLSLKEDLQTVSEMVSKAIESHSDLFAAPYRVRNPEDGQVVWLELNAKVVYDEAGNAQRMFGVAQNITENKRSQEEIQVVSRMPEENPNPAMRLTPSGEVLYANPASRPMLDAWTQQAGQKMPAELQKAVTDTFASRQKTELEIQHGEKFFSYTLAPIPEAGYVNLYGKDITERKQAEQTLAEFACQQEALYQLSDQLHHTTSLEDVYTAALDAILNGLQCDRASILLFDEAGVMRFVAWRGLSDDYRKATQGHSPWSTNEKNPYPICVGDIHTADLSDALKAAIQKEGIGSLAFIPLLLNGKLIGKFMMYFNTPHDCSDVEIELGLMIARQLAFGVDRKRAEEALRASEERHRGIVNQTIGGIAETDLTGKFTMVNDHYCEITGYTRERLLNEMRMQDITHPDDLPRNSELFGRLLTEGDSFEIEKRYVRPDGSIVWVHNSVSALIGTDGKPHSAVAVVIDVTERKRVEEQLHKSAEFDAFRLALVDALRPLSDPQEILTEAMHVLGEKLQVDRVLYSEIENDDETILILDNYVKDGVPKLIGRASLDDYGKARQPLSTGKNLIIEDAITSPDMDEKDRSAFAALGIRSGIAVPLIKGERWMATLGVHHSRVRTWTENEIKFMEETAERTWSALERANAQQKLRASEALYRAIARSIPGGGVYVVDRDFRYLVAEGPVTEAFGLTREMLEGHAVREVFPDERGTRMEDRLRRNFAGETVNFETEHKGRVYWTQQAPLLDSIGQAMILTLDITERKRAEEALRIENERFMRFVDSNIVGILIGDSSGKITLANDYYLHLLGVSRQDFIEHRIDWKQFTPPEWSHADEKAIQELRERGVCEPYEKEYVRTDGTRVPVYIADAMLPGPREEIAAFVLDITERKRAEEALRQSEERFARFMQHLPGLAWIKDAQGRYIFANAAAEKAFGIPREKLYGKTDTEVFPPEVAVQFRQNDEQALVSEKGMQTVETLPQEDSVLHYSLVTKFPIPGPDGNTALIGGTAFDITERLQAEEALRKSEERFRALVSQATAGIVRQDAEGRLTFVNQAFCNMLGYTELNLLGKTSWEFTHEDDVAENKRLYERMMTEGIPFKLEKRLLRADGSVLWVDVSVDPVMDAEGRPESAVAVEIDITGRKQAEEALQQLNLQLENRVQKRTATIQAINQSLREEIAERKRIEEALRQSESAALASEEKLHTLFDLLPVGITFLDPEGKVLQTNSALLNIVKLSKEQLFSQAYKSRKYIRADGTPMPLSEFASARALRENRTIYNVETGIILESGEVVWTSVSAAPVDVADVGVVVVTIDITESKRAERALKESHRRLSILSQRLVEVQEEERQALARELHDRVGQTLAALNINLIIINGQLSPEVAQQIGVRLNDSMKLVAETIALVRDVMTDLRPAVLDDYGLEAALESQLTKFTSRYNIKTVFEKPERPIPRLGPSVEMTLLRIAQEALINIARHSRAELVNLSLWQEVDAVCLRIHDDGIGIESWQEVNRPGSHGLTIMRERAAAFGGELRLSSVPGEGTTVEVTIPFKNDGQEKVEENHL